jgi:hypothetical protein
VQLVVRRGARRGAAGVLAFVQFRSGYKLGTGDLPEDIAAGALEDFKDDLGGSDHGAQWALID